MAKYTYSGGKRIYVPGTRTDADRAYTREWERRRRAASADIRKAESSRQREYQKANPLAFGWHNSRTSARTRGYVWELSRETFEQLSLAACAYCGSAPLPTNGIDRIDNSIGYTEENSTTACSVCNYAKKAMSVSEFLDWARRVVLFNQKG